LLNVSILYADSLNEISIAKINGGINCDGKNGVQDMAHLNLPCRRMKASKDAWKDKNLFSSL
jgi:hypothetical protein